VNHIARQNCGGSHSVSLPLFRKIAVIGIFTLFACAAQTTVSEKSDTTLPNRAVEAAQPLGVAVLPVKNMTTIYGENTSVRSPLTGKMFITGPVTEEAPILLAERMVALLEEIPGYDVLPPERTRVVYEQELSGGPSRFLDRQSLARLGQRLGVDAVMVSHIYRFRERQGNRLAARSPASVAFDMQLVLTDRGRIVWNGHADETQSALSEDLFQIGKFIRRQGRWITAGEMTDASLSMIFESFPSP